MTEMQPMMIAVRGYAEPFREHTPEQNKPGRRKRKGLPSPSDVTIIFDTETDTGYAQHLRFGTFQVRIGELLEQKGIFYEPDNLKLTELRLLQRYASERSIALMTREEFVRDVFYYYGYDRGGLILGFNLPFDLSRLAVRIGTSKGRDMRNGFSLELLPEKWRPNVLVKHLNSRTAFIRFAAHSRPTDARSARKKGIKTEAKRGYFQDVRTLGAALKGGSHTLGSLANLLQTEHRKQETDEHGGKLTGEYLDYALNDTQVTWECYANLRDQYKLHGLEETPPHRIYSEASLGKAYFREMGVLSWRKVQPSFDQDMLGGIMSTYFGGRSEVRIRRQIVRVLYCDFRSMYPTVCTLMGLWRYVIAQGIEIEDVTDWVRQLLASVTLCDLQQPSFWRTLNVLVRVAPNSSVLPVRAPYDEKGGSRTIGLNRLSAKFGLWYTLADCIASTLLAGKAPQVLQAVRFNPKGKQRGLASIAIAGDERYIIDPNKDDLFKRVIELRGEVQTREKEVKAAGDRELAEQLASHSQMLKLLANSTSYGIFAEMNVQSYDRPKHVCCFGNDGHSYDTASKSVEEPGTHFHPLLATLITGAARLMLAIAERVAIDQEIGWAFCDTDSLALARPDGMDDGEFLRRALAVTD